MIYTQGQTDKSALVKDTVIQLAAHEEFHNVHFKSFIVALSYALSLESTVEFCDFLFKHASDLEGVLNVTILIFGFLSTHCFNVETDHFAVCAIVMIAENFDLVESAAERFNTEALVLVVTAAVLIVEVNGTEFSEFKSKSHFVCGIKSGEDGVCRLENSAYTVRIFRSSGYSHNVTDSSAVAAIDGLVGFGFDEYFDLAVVSKHIVDRINELSDLLNGILGFSRRKGRKV